MVVLACLSDGPAAPASPKAGPRSFSGGDISPVSVPASRTGESEGSNLKTCSRCGVEKPTTEFYRNRGNRDGREYRCKDCGGSRGPSGNTPGRCAWCGCEASYICPGCFKREWDKIRREGKPRYHGVADRPKPERVTIKLANTTGEDSLCLRRRARLLESMICGHDGYNAAQDTADSAGTIRAMAEVYRERARVKDAEDFAGVRHVAV